VPVRNYIAFAIPFFLVFMGLEILVARAQRRGVYRLQDALADLGCGVGQQIVMVFAGAAVVAAYAALYDRFRLFTFGAASPIPWAISFVVVDLAYYWWHRLSHEVNFLWAAHAVHHQSEDYNLAVALRQSILTSFTSLPFYYPMAFLGVPPVVYATMVAASTLYQFWIHTELVGKLGRLERVLNTPSHHRVHHAVNPQYLDKNYGAILIVWDRLFGTFTEEREPAVFGTTKPIRSFNPLWAQAQAWFEIAEKARPLRGIRDRARIWLAPPSYDPLGRPAPGEADLRSRAKHGVAIPGALKAYALAQFAPLIAGTFLMLLWQYSAPRGPLLVAAGFVFLTLGSLGALLDGRRWGVPLELARLAALAAALVAWRPGGVAPELAAALALGGAAAFAGWLLLAVRSSSPEAAPAGLLPR
jgi:sterol desaturase/sphingolipid hydroxylase (fatty acid hydroxylase superfamily)